MGFETSSLLEYKHANIVLHKIAPMSNFFLFTIGSKICEKNPSKCSENKLFVCENSKCEWFIYCGFSLSLRLTRALSFSNRVLVRLQKSIHKANTTLIQTCSVVEKKDAHLDSTDMLLLVLLLTTTHEIVNGKGKKTHANYRSHHSISIFCVCLFCASPATARPKYRTWISWVAVRLCMIRRPCEWFKRTQ